jgi:argininosuccinate lyase
VGDRDFACELLADLAIIAMHLSRLSEDLILWCTSEFGFLALSDAFTTGSSLMPQKKNPDVAELTRGKTGRVYGNLISLLTTMKALPLTYNRDMQEDKEAIFDSLDTVKGALAIYAAMIATAKPNVDRCLDAVRDPNLLATDLADYLVNRGVPFRHAHEAVGKAVAKAAENGVPLPSLTLPEYQEIHPEYGPDLYECFDLNKAMSARKAVGAPSPGNVLGQLERWKSVLAAEGAGNLAE